MLFFKVFLLISEKFFINLQWQKKLCTFATASMKSFNRTMFNVKIYSYETHRNNNPSCFDADINSILCSVQQRVFFQKTRTLIPIKF